VWRCTRNAQGGKKHPKGRCDSGSTYETALEQSFMEMLYGLKRDYEANKDASRIVVLFREACEKADRVNGKNSHASRRLEMLETQLKELEQKLHETMGKQMEALRNAAIEKDEMLRQGLEDGDVVIDDIEVDLKNGVSGIGMIGTGWLSEYGEEGSEAAIYGKLADDIRERMEALKKERAVLETEQGATTIMRKNFDFFIRCLKELPEVNLAGMKLNVNGLDVDGSLFRDADGKAKAGKRSSARSGHLKITEDKIAASPDLLRFEKGIYIAFIKSGVVRGDEVDYTTNFGVTLTSYGNSRTLGSFLGFRKAEADGTVDILDENWKVSGRGVCYTRKEKKDKG
jgi:hypothetical protein